MSKPDLTKPTLVITGGCGLFAFMAYNDYTTSHQKTYECSQCGIVDTEGAYVRGRWMCSDCLENVDTMDSGACEKDLTELFR